MPSLHGLLQGIRLGLFQVKDVVLERSQEIRKITLQNLCFLEGFCVLAENQAAKLQTSVFQNLLRI